MAALTVVCINVGNYRGRGEEYVAKLYNMLQRNLSVKHEFICLTEEDLNERGWWSKVELTKPGRFSGWTLYLDLDIVITANIDALTEPRDPEKVWMRDDFSYSLRKPKEVDFLTRRLLGGPGCCNSSVILWHGDTLAPVWEAWQARRDEILKTLHGDQNLISQVMRERIGFLPDELIQSYKYGIGLARQKPGPIVVFHGEPKADGLHERWITEHWC